MNKIRDNNDVIGNLFKERMRFEFVMREIERIKAENGNGKATGVELAIIEEAMRRFHKLQEVELQIKEKVYHNGGIHRFAWRLKRKVKSTWSKLTWWLKSL